jgi:hypothetical protein
MKYTRLDDVCGNLEGFATSHRSLLARCFPHAVFEKNCDSPYGTTFFEEVQMNLSNIQNQSLPDPKRAREVVQMANSPGMILGSGITLVVSVSYEVVQFVFRNFVCKNPR